MRCRCRHRSRLDDLPGARLRPGGGAAGRFRVLVPAPAEVAAQALIVGGGAAGDAAAAGIRSAGFKGSVLLLAAEPWLPYQRPPLSKEYLTGRAGPQVLPLRPEPQYRELEVEVRTGVRVLELEVDRRRVRLDTGEPVGYDRLLLATGGRPRQLPGQASPLYLRTRADADRLRRALLEAPRLQVVGAGFIGCEVAAAARELGREVSVHEALEQPLLRVLGPELGGWLAGVHSSRGVDLRLGVKSLPELPSPVLAAVGSLPETDLAERAGLAVEGGILVDELGRTSVPDVYAAGDAARFWSSTFEARVRVEHFQTAQRHGFAAGRSLAGAGAPFAEVPWFWSDQYDLNLQYAGAGLPWEETAVRGRLGRPPFTVFYLAGGRLLAAAGCNDGHTISRARRLIERKVAVSRSQLEDPRLDLKGLL